MICEFESSARPSFRVFAGTDIWSKAAKPWTKNHEAPLPSRSAELQCVPWLLARKKQCLFCGYLYLSQLGAFVVFSGWKSKVSGDLGWPGHADAYRWGGLHAEVDSCGATAGWSWKDRVGKPQYDDVKTAPVRLPVWEDEQGSKFEFEAKNGNTQNNEDILESWAVSLTYLEVLNFRSIRTFGSRMSGSENLWVDLKRPSWLWWKALCLSESIVDQKHPGEMPSSWLII